MSNAVARTPVMAVGSRLNVKIVPVAMVAVMKKEAIKGIRIMLKRITQTIQESMEDMGDSAAPKPR